ncbi:MAG TPA: YggT family protein, partial [Pyrinomonadaceae bacterium]|nr:YggT family protein [Pyrinomonadaceae bacterium]
MDNTTFLFQKLVTFVNTGIVAAIVFVIVLMLLRLALNYADLNPFRRPVMLVRRLTDPLINTVRRALVGFGFSPNFAPLVTILIAILVGWLAVQLADDVLSTIYGAIMAARAGRPVALVGTLLYGLLSIYALLIFTRIIFSWGQVSYANRLMRFLVRTTEPLLGPLRRIIPTVGFFDISPIVAFFII